MAKLLQLRGGTTSQHSSFTGAVREVTVDTDKDVLVVHDGSTAGGFPAHRDLKGSDIASADPLVITAGSNYYIVTGTTGFNDMTVAANHHFFLEFAGALVMTHVGGALDLPSGAAITTAAGDVGEFFATAANVVTCVNYTKASGLPVTKVTYAGIQNVSGTNKILGRDSSGAGDIEEITPANLLTMLGVETAADVTDATNVAAAGAGMLTADQSWAGSQRGTPSTVTDGTLDLDTANNFQYTPATNPDTLEFSNEEAGQSGFIKVINASGKTIALGSEVKKGASWDVSTAGTYLVSYYCDGTDVYVSASEALS